MIHAPVKFYMAPKVTVFLSTDFTVRCHSLGQKLRFFVPISSQVSYLIIHKDLDHQWRKKTQGKPLSSKGSVINLNYVRVMSKRQQQTNWFFFWTISMLYVIRKVRIIVKYLSVVLVLKIAQNSDDFKEIYQPTIIPQNAGNT